MIRLQTTKLPATVLAFLPRLRNQILCRAQKFVSHETANLFCGIELMLLLSKHAQFEREAAGISPASLMFYFSGFDPTEMHISPEGNSAETVFKPLSGAQSALPR